jgi:hypothetical protein
MENSIESVDDTVESAVLESNPSITTSDRDGPVSGALW